MSLPPPEKPVDLLLTEAQVLNVFTGELLALPLAIHEGHLLGWGDWPALQTLSLPDRILLPGFCDGHLHLESSLLSPAEFARAAVLHGTTAVVADPHEIANVCGRRGLQYLLQSCPTALLELYLMAPSCVPATPFETSGAVLTAEDLRTLLQWPQVLGLGEMMNFPGVLKGDPEVLAKLAVAQGRPRDGHAPGLIGASLQRYAALGPESDHEATTLQEGQERLAAGMWLMIREGSSARNLEALAPLLSSEARGRCLLVSDDLGAQDLLQRGHLDHLLREAVRLGVRPLDAVRAVSLNPAQRFGLPRRGALAPGYVADLVAVENLRDFRVTEVFKGGLPVVREGELLLPSRPPTPAPNASVLLPPLSPESFRLQATGDSATVRLIVAQDGSLLTAAAEAKLEVHDGCLQTCPAADLLKLAVIERHGHNGNIGLGMIRGFGLREGALASTVAHDSHNLIAVGCDDQSLCTAARAVGEAGGGLCVAVGTQVRALLPLPVAGLMSDRPAAEVARAHERIEQAARALGSPLTSPFATLSFMALPVIPELKLTDRGLFAVSSFRHVPLFV